MTGRHAQRRPPRSSAWLPLLALALLASACGDCHDEAPSAASASPSADAPNQPERWTLGAVDLRTAIALPPPCRIEQALRAAIERPTLLRAAAGSLDEIVGVQGPLIALGSGPIRYDAAGIYRMDHGVAPVRPILWPPSGQPELARASQPDGWLIGYPQPSESRLWQAGQSHSLPGRLLASRCDGASCGVLLADDDQPGSAALVRVGRADQPASQWQQLPIQHHSLAHARPTALLHVAAAGPSATVAFVDDLRVRLLSARLGEDATPLASMQLPHGMLDVTATPAPAALAYSGPLDARRCASAAAGVVVVPAAGQAASLRSPLPPSEGHIRPLPHGWLVSWLSPLRCESHQQLLYAAVVVQDGRPVGAVTSVAEVDSYALATRGDELALWLVQGNTLSWLKARCTMTPR